MSNLTEWPPKGGLGTPTVPHDSAILPVYATCRIQAPAHLVLEVIRETDKYGEWNSWVPKVDINSQPDGSDAGSRPGYMVTGTSFTFQVIMDSKKPDKYTATQLRCSDISTPEASTKYIPDSLLATPENQDRGCFTADLSKVYRIAWKTEGGFVSRGLRSERFHELIVINENECECRTWEVMGGVLAHTVKWMFSKKLSECFEIWCRDLKARAESLVQTSH